MIIKHKSLNYSDRIFKSVIDYANKEFKGLDGIVEVFINEREQGYVLKIYDSYDPEYDTCIWLFEMPLQEELNIIIGNRKDCLDNNAWSKEMFDKRIKYKSSEYKEVIDFIFKYLKDTYEKEIDVKINIQECDFIEEKKDIINSNYTLGDLISCIGSLIKQYENNLNIENTNTDKSGRLLKTKDVIKEYPYLTIYALDKAVKDKKLPVTKIGNTNYFNTDDIEAFINIGKKDIND